MLALAFVLRYAKWVFGDLFYPALFNAAWISYSGGGEGRIILTAAAQGKTILLGYAL